MRRDSEDKRLMPQETAAGTMRRTAALSYYSSGSPGVDKLLGGGFREGRVTEVSGRSGSGKSLLAAQSVLLASKMGRKSLYIDTEGSFRPERLQQVADARGWGHGLLEKIVYVRADSAAEQVEAVRKMAARGATSACGLVVVDTLTRNFSVELPGRSNLSSRQGALDVHLSEMARDAYLHGRAYIATNRVTFGPVHDIGIGGKTVEQLVHSSVRLEREGGEVKAILGSGEDVAVKIGPSGID